MAHPSASFIALHALEYYFPSLSLSSEPQKQARRAGGRIRERVSDNQTRFAKSFRLLPRMII